MNRLAIDNATILPMVGTRAVIASGHVLVDGDRITAVGAGPAPAAPDAERIDARGGIVMPGFVDAHAHAGHALTKGLGTDSGEWMRIAGRIYAEATDGEFWRAEAALSALERLRCGTTTACLLLGGGPDVMRTHTRETTDAHRDGLATIGVAEVLAIGPNRPDGPRRYRDWTGGEAREHAVSPEGQLRICAALLREGARGLSAPALSLPVFSPSEIAASAERVDLSRAGIRLAADHGVTLVQDGHRDGSVAAAELALGSLPADALFAHSVDLTEGDIAALLRCGAKVAHNPSALMSVVGRCPAPELRQAGVTVALGSDAPAPDRGFDMFRILFQAHRYHARHFRDDTVLPPWDLLEMATIEGAKALGLEGEIGSLEPGKRADLIVVDWRRPHLWPPAEPVQRLTKFASGADVATVVVAGRVLMRDRVLAGIDEDRVLRDAEAAYALMLDRAGLAARFPRYETGARP